MVLLPSMAAPESEDEADEPEGGYVEQDLAMFVPSLAPPPAPVPPEDDIDDGGLTEEQCASPARRTHLHTPLPLSVLPAAEAAAAWGGGGGALFRAGGRR